MQTDKLYQTESVGEIETTADLSSISDDNFLSDFTDPYLMGYIPNDQVPACLAPIKLTTADGSLTLQPDLDVNIGWGYCQRNFNADVGEIAVTDGSTLSRYCPVSSPQSFFINDIEMSRVVNQGQITVTYFAEFIKNDFYDDGIGTTGFVYGGTNAGSVVSSRFFTETYNITDFMDICKNGGVLIDRTLTSTYQYSPIYGIDFPIRLTADDFPKPTNSDDLRGVFLDFTTTADCHIFVAIAGYSFAFPVYVHSDDSISNLHLVPFSAFSDGSKKYMYVPPVEPTNQAIRCKYNKSTHVFSDFTPVADSSRPGFAYDSTDGYISGGFNLGHIDRSDGIDDIVYPGRNYAIRRNYYIEFEQASGDVVTLRIQSIYSLSDIYNFVALWHKHAKTEADISPTYNDSIYTTVFTNSNVPTLRTVSGNLSDIQVYLQPWQYPDIDITVNTFTPTDIPDSDRYSINRIRFGNITPSEFLFVDISIEKIYFGSYLLYQKLVPEQYVKLNPTDKFISEKTSVDDYRIYGELPAGDIVLSVRTPRTRNLLPYPYVGFFNAEESYVDETSVDLDFSIHSTGVVDVASGYVNNKFSLRYTNLPNPPFVLPAGTYTASVRPSEVSDGYHTQLEVRAAKLSDLETIYYTAADYQGSRRWTGRITFTLQEPSQVWMQSWFGNGYTYNADTLYPQLEAGGDVTEYEPPNDPILTTITLPRALEENEYISYADQKIMPTGTPLVVPKLKTIVGENVIMIENYPSATNTITLTPATKE